MKHEASSAHDDSDAKRRDELVCVCLKQTYGALSAAAHDLSAEDLALLKRATGAGTRCNLCVPDLKRILDAVCANREKGQSQ